MTELSIQMKDKICQYCGNQDGKHCRADVPYYCVSIWCNYFIEKSAEPPTEKRKLSPEAQMRKLIKRTMVETF
jgi:hypothetical protein